MSTTYEVEVVRLHVKDDGDLSGIVVEADIRMVISKDGHEARIPLLFKLGPPTQSAFTPLDDLTHAKFMEWVEADSAQFNHYKSHCDRVLARQIEEEGMRKLTPPWNSAI